MNLFDKDENKNVDIPDFVEDKDDSTSVDMSIFKMSDDELYDDSAKEEKANKPLKKKSNSTIILCLVLVVILLVTSVVSVIYALKEHKSAATLTEQVSQLTAQKVDYESKINALNAQVTELNAKIDEIKNAGTTVDPDNKYPKGTKLYITEAGGVPPQAVRSKADVNSETVYNEDGTPVLLDWDFDTPVVLIADATKDANGNYWGKIDSGYFRIEYNGEIWATANPE